MRIASIADVPPEPLARLYTTLIVPELNLAPGAAVPLVTDPRFAGSPVLLVNERPAGMLLIEANNGQNVCIVTARAVIPEYRGEVGGPICCCWPRVLNAPVRRARCECASRLPGIIPTR